MESSSSYRNELISVNTISPLWSEWRSVEACRGKQEDKITFVSNWLIPLPPTNINWMQAPLQWAFSSIFSSSNALIGCIYFLLELCIIFVCLSRPDLIFEFRYILGFFLAALVYFVWAARASDTFLRDVLGLWRNSKAERRRFRFSIQFSRAGPSSTMWRSVNLKLALSRLSVKKWGRRGRVMVQLE